MNAYILCMLAAASADPATEPPVVDSIGYTVYEPSEEFEISIRGQEPTYADPLYTDPGAPAGSYVAPTQPAPIYAPQTNPFVNPFMNQPPMGVGPAQGGFVTGLNGPQPYKFGWTSRGSFGYLPSASTSPDFGNYTVTEADLDLEYTSPIAPGWIGTFTQQFGWRGLEGPSGPIDLPGSLWNVGWDFELATPQQYGYSFQMAVNPSMNTDFQSTSLSSNAWNIDARAILFIHHSPEWLIALGAGYWDRVDDIVVPYAGVVWTPNNYWEVRLLFPESRISYFLGQNNGFAEWLYVTAEYNVEAYEYFDNNFQTREQMQYRDVRLLVGLRADNGLASFFVEAGGVVGRKTKFKVNNPGYDIGDGFITRAGIKY